MIIDFLAFILDNIASSSNVNGLLMSNKAIIKSLLFIISLLFSTPSFSTTLFVSLIPAVSIKFSVTPFIVMFPSTMSLVVPSISVTIALSSFISKFNKLLLPTFGFPTIPTFIPLFKSVPFSLSLTSFSKSDCISFIFVFNSSFVYIIASSYSG